MTVWPTQKSKEGDVWLTERACETTQFGARPADAMKPVNGFILNGFTVNGLVLRALPEGLNG